LLRQLKRGSGVLKFARSLDWLRLIRMLAQYIVPGLVVVALLAELTSAGSSNAYNVVHAGLDQTRGRQGTATMER
jgi:hypothetical protein